MYKSKLQELCHRHGWNLPEYTTVKDGPDHNPCFAATVTVNGVSFESPKDQCRSSKEAQNVAAHIAFNHFTAPKSILSKQSPIALPLAAPPTASSGASTSNSSKVDVRPSNMDIFQQRKNNTGQISQVNEPPLAGRVGNSPNGMLHLYKNRLQNYVQKHNLTLPEYSCELEGPPHARRFRSKVAVNGRIYGTQEFFSTLKEAEHAAAKVAFQSLELNDIHEDEGLYKTLLQELAQKNGLPFPVYDTARSGPPHMPIFCSTVEVGGGTFQGHESKTKKQAEMNAAKVAYNALVERKEGHQLDESSKLLSTRLGHVVADALEPVQQKNKLIINDLPLQTEEAETNAKEWRCSTALNAYAVARDPCPAGSCLPDGQSSALTILDHSSTDSVADSGIVPSEKIFIFPRNANVEFPGGASILPCSDEKWVAVRLELEQTH